MVRVTVSWPLPVNQTQILLDIASIRSSGKCFHGEDLCYCGDVLISNAATLPSIPQHPLSLVCVASPSCRYWHLHLFRYRVVNCEDFF